VKYRSRTDIVSEILKIASGGVSKTKIMYGAYLSYDQLKDYLQVMLENGLLEKKAMQYRTTKKGFDFLKGYERLDQMFAVEPAKSKNP
jgi:predicted transcriptional regulator